MHPRHQKLSTVAAAFAAVACFTLAPLVAGNAPQANAPAAEESKEKGCCASCCCCGHGEDGASCSRPHAEAEGEAGAHHHGTNGHETAAGADGDKAGHEGKGGCCCCCGHVAGTEGAAAKKGCC